MPYDLTYSVANLYNGSTAGDISVQGPAQGAQSKIFFSNIVFSRNAENGILNKVRFTFQPQSGPGNITLTRYYVVINGITAYDSNPGTPPSFQAVPSANVYDPTYFPDPTNQSAFYEISGAITSINFYGFVNAENNGRNATTVINLTYKVVTVNEKDDFIFLNTASLPTFVFLPTVSDTRKNLLIIKDISGNAQNQNITVISSTDARVEFLGQTSTLINTNWGCLSLFLENRPTIYYMWHIANYYKNDIGTDGRFSPSTTVTNTASCDNINIYSTSNNIIQLPNTVSDPDRTTGHNYLFLQNPWFCTNRLCVVVYCGNLGSRGFDNRLVFNGRQDRFISGNIDGFSPSSNTNSPFVVCKDSAQSTGVIFVSNGIQWYIVGWMNNMDGDGYWQWRDQEPPLSDTTGIGNSPFAFISNDSSSYYRKWDISTSNFVILKNRNGRSGGSTYNGWPWVSNNNGIFLNSTYQWIQTYRPTDFSCIWLIREPRANSVHYHPIVGYIN